jgi:hypothetical protein
MHHSFMPVALFQEQSRTDSPAYRPAEHDAGEEQRQHIGRTTTAATTTRFTD